MEKISDLLDNLKERLSNPLIFSFMFCWLFFNWEIPVALLWYDPQQLLNEHYTSIFSFIQSKLWWCRSIVLPFVFALLYTFLLPIVKNGIYMFQAWNSKWGNKMILKISENATISFDRYISIKNKYEEQKKKLAVAFEEESSIRNDLAVTISELNNARSEINALKQAKGDLEYFQANLNDFRIIQGKWSFIRGDENYNIEIVSNNFFPLDKFNGKTDKRYIVANFFFDSRYDTIFFVIYEEKGNTSKPVYIYI